MCNIFNRITLSVCVIVHRINAPFISCAMMCNMTNAIHQRITEMHIRRSHVDLCTKCFVTVFKFTGTHSCKEIKILFYTTIAVRTILSRLCRCAFHCSNFFCCRIINVSQSFFDQLACILIKFFEIIGSIEFIGPVKT